MIVKRAVFAATLVATVVLSAFHAGATVDPDTGWDDRFAAVTGQGMDGSVYALAVSGSDVYAGGAFTTAGATSASHIAKWDGSAWSALGAGTTGNIAALAVIGTDLYAGGSDPLVKWNGSSWSPVLNAPSDVSALAVAGTDLIVGGDFVYFPLGVELQRIAKWDGSNWLPIRSFGGRVSALAVRGSSI